jgi:hypothetical protein
LTRKRGVPFLLAASLALWACGGTTVEVLDREPPSGVPSSFLERRGSELYLDGRPYRYLSFTAFSLTGCGLAGEVPDDAALAAFFSSLRPRSLVRTYALAAFGVERVERVVAAARSHGHLLTLVLADDAGECNDGDTKKSSDWYESGFREGYLTWVQTIVARLAAEPAVGMWEPMKGATDVDALTLRTFYDVVGLEIRRLDENHLIESGTHGPWAYGGEEGYALVHQSAGIDVAASHDYDTGSDSPPNLAAALRGAAAVGKPLVVAELGMLASPSGDPDQQVGSMVCLSFQERREALERQFQAAFASPLSGINVWNWMPIRQDGCNLTIAPGDLMVASMRSFPLP